MSKKDFELVYAQYNRIMPPAQNFDTCLRWIYNWSLKSKEQIENTPMMIKSISQKEAADS